MASSAAAAVAMAPSPPSPSPSSSPSPSPSPSPSSFSLSRHTHLIFANRLRLPPQLSSPSRRNSSCMITRATVEETSSNNSSAAASALSDSVVPQVAVLEDEPDTPGVAPPTSTASAKRKLSPLERGGTLTGDKAAGKDPSPSVLGKSATRIAISGPFRDPRWKNGTWDLQMFMRDGKVDWDAVIDAEVLRRKWLEENPEASRNDEPVVFETSTIPWWAWVKRFHLPEAELLNGRAAMIGFFMGYVVDSLTGVGLVDQTSSFFGKLLLFISVLGVLFIRKNEDVEALKQLVKEWNFYDKQWQATWQEDQTSSTKSDE